MPDTDDQDPEPSNVIPFPAMRANAKLLEAWSSALTVSNEKMRASDVFPSPLDCLEDIMRRRGLPVFPWPGQWAELGKRARAYAGDCIVVTGPTGAGKTSWAIQVALSSTGNGIPVIWCSLELDPTQITERIVANMHGVHTMAIKEHWGRDRIAHSLAAVSDMWRFVPRIMDVDQQLAALRRAIALVFSVYRVKPLVVIDYLGKLSSMARDIRQATIQAAEQLRSIAVEHECFILILAQPSRAKNQALTGKVEHESATDTSGSAAESGEAENAAAIEINLEVFKANDRMELDARWHLAKSRHIGGETTIGARFSKPGGRWTELDSIPVHPTVARAEHEKMKKDKHRAGPPPSLEEVTRDLNASRADDAEVMRRAKLLEALKRHGMLGMDLAAMKVAQGIGRGSNASRLVQDLERAGAVEKIAGPRWRAITRIE